MTWTAKDIRLKPISFRQAREKIQELHYSGKTTNNSQLNIGIFLGASLEGAMMFGPPMDRNKMLGLVRGSGWENVMELNRLALSERLPVNSESRALGVAMRIIKKHAPQIKWIISFADGAQCGDGTIYRAAGFKLTGIKPSTQLARLPDGSVIHQVVLAAMASRPRPELGGRSYFDVTGGRFDFKKYLQEAGGEVIPGFQLRYIKFVDPAWEERLTAPVLPFEEIDRRNARMYRGEKPE